MKMIYKRVVVFLGCMMLAACGSFLGPQKMPPISRYTLRFNQSVPMKVAHQSISKTLFIAQPMAASGYQTTHMMYFKNPNQLSTYKEHEWVSPPSQILLPLLVESFTQQAYFSSVISPPVSGMSDYTLNVTLIELAQDFSTEQPTLHCVVQASLTDNALNTVIADEFIRVTVPTKKSPEAGVVSANDAVLKMLSKVNDFVKANVNPK